MFSDNSSLSHHETSLNVPERFLQKAYNKTSAIIFLKRNSKFFGHQLNPVIPKSNVFIMHWLVVLNPHWFPVLLALLWTKHFTGSLTLKIWTLMSPFKPQSFHRARGPTIYSEHVSISIIDAYELYLAPNFNEILVVVSNMYLNCGPHV